MKLGITALAVAIVSALPGRAEASGTINISQVGADVVETGGAKFNLARFRVRPCWARLRSLSCVSQGRISSLAFDASFKM
jgi:hypothetical protein